MLFLQVFDSEGVGRRQIRLEQGKTRSRSVSVDSNGIEIQQNQKLRDGRILRTSRFEPEALGEVARQSETSKSGLQRASRCQRLLYDT